MKRRTVSGASQEAHESSDYELIYTYHVVATADIAIPVTSAESGAVDITFTMTTDGMLQFTVVRANGDAVNNEGSTANVDIQNSGSDIVTDSLADSVYDFVTGAAVDAVGNNMPVQTALVMFVIFNGY